MKRGKNYKVAKLKIKSLQMPLDDALAQVQGLSTTKFVGKIEIHVKLNLNDKEKKQPVRGSAIYSKPVGKLKKILVFADASKQDDAKSSGADYYGLDELISKIKDGWVDFDIAIATPSVMPKIAVLGRVLGTKGLMPNIKSGTVTDDIKTAVESYKVGRIDFKSDDTGVIHSIIGNKNSDIEDLKENIKIFLKAITQNSGKPMELAIKSVYLNPTMGPSLKVAFESILKEF